MIKMIALIWDFDGVVVFTPHEKAWRITAHRFGILNLTSEFYHRYVSGRPRYEGARIILSLLGGYAGPELEQLVELFASEKNRVFNLLVESGEVEVNRPAIEFILRTRRGNRPAFKHVLASASRNAARLATRLEYLGRPLSSFFDADVSGSGATKREIFEKAMKAVREADCFIAIDDAPSGVRTAAELGIIPVGYSDRGLEDHGARMIIEKFEGLEPEVLVELCRSR